MQRYDAEEVKRYYENNTSLLLRLGQGVDGTIRRAVWGPGVARRRDAMVYVDDLIVEHLKVLAARLDRTLRILDLGCGAAASLCRIATQCDIVGTGVTISPAQVELAKRHVLRHGLGDRVRILEADYCRLPQDVRNFDLAFAIESFVHAPEATQFFSAAFSVLNPGGILIVCDDFASREPEATTARERRWLRRYAEGWRVSSLLAPAELQKVSTEAGFVGETSRDLTPFVELGRPRDYAIALFARGLSWLPLRGSYWSMLKGGDALQRCLKRGWISYRFCTWQRPESGRLSPE